MAIKIAAPVHPEHAERARLEELAGKTTLTTAEQRELLLLLARKEVARGRSQIPRRP